MPEFSTLLLDIYTPVGDNNCLRPLLVLVHGGAWIAGSKSDGSIVSIAQKMAQKGYVVAAVNYRLGTHKAASYSMYWACNNNLSQPCGYIADSSEVIRANYRGMQDVKGAIRYMKSRHLLDSVDHQNVFIAGESAGAFVSLAVALTDQASEKPADAGAIANAPTPDPDLVSCLPAGYSLQRPDLGPVDGTLNIGSYDAKVRGVGSFYGGLFDLNLFSQMADTPAVYLFHQGSDVVVHWQYGRLLGRTSYECYVNAGNICQPYYFYPSSYGGESIRQHLAGMATSPAFQADIISNYSYNNNCFSNGHSIDNITTRTQNMADLFAVEIAATGNNPLSNCLTGITENSEVSSIFPNPLNGRTLTVQSRSAISELKLLDLSGKVIYKTYPNSKNSKVDLPENLQQGVYFVVFKAGDDYVVEKVVVL